MVSKSRAAGSFLGGILGSPTVALLLLGLGALLIFRKDITGALGSISAPTINLPEIKFPEFPEIKFPEFPTFPDFGSFFGFGGNGDQPEEPFETSPEVTEAPECVCGTNIVQDALGGVVVTCKACPEPPPFRDAEMFAKAFPEPFIPTAQEVPPEIVVDPSIGGEFEGGGVSFIGGSISEIPFCNKSIGDIASEFGISASAAANMKFIECENSGGFDFTQPITGSGAA